MPRSRYVWGIEQGARNGAPYPRSVIRARRDYDAAELHTSAHQRMIFARISLRMTRACARRSSQVPCSAPGSAKLQCKRCVCPGNTGQRSALDSSQTVITYENILPALNRSNTPFARFADISTPISRITAIARGFRVPGSRPALSAIKSSGQSAFRNASAIWLLAPLCTHINRTSRFTSSSVR